MDAELRVDALGDDVLIARTMAIAARGRRNDAVLVAHMAEVDARRLYLREACASMFAYATERLLLSECQAYERIAAARAARVAPAVLEMLAEGRLTLTAVALLRPHLTPENAGDLLARAAGRSKRQVQVLVAEIAPRPDVPAVIRRLPEVRPEPVAGPEPVARPEVRPEPVAASAARPEPPRPAPLVLEPIAPARFKVQFTASAELEEKFRRAKALLRHAVPDGDLGEIVDRAMTLLVADLEKKRCAKVERPRQAREAAEGSRHVPAAVRREVWKRDEGRCTFVDASGNRCRACAGLEVHHEEPFARGGASTVENLRLLCNQHNRYRAELDFGRAFVEERIRLVATRTT
jgi:hypothetical protein